MKVAVGAGVGAERVGPNHRWWLAAAVGALMFVGCWVGLGKQQASAVAVPRFLPPAAAPVDRPVAVRTGLLPDCGQVVPDSIDPAALLAQPSGSVAVHPVVGTPAPAVALLARTSCTYRRGTGAKGPNMLGQVSLSAFTDSAGAASQRQRNIAAEGSAPGTTVAPVELGAARATMLTSLTSGVLMTSYDRYTVTVTLPRAMFPAPEEKDVLIDLTRRALASMIGPTPTTDHASPRTSPVLAKG